MKRGKEMLIRGKTEKLYKPKQERREDTGRREEMRKDVKENKWKTVNALWRPTCHIAHCAVLVVQRTTVDFCYAFAVSVVGP